MAEEEGKSGKCSHGYQSREWTDFKYVNTLWCFYAKSTEKSFGQMHSNSQLSQDGSHLSIESYSHVPPLMLCNANIFISLWKVLVVDKDLNKLNM